MDGHQRVQDVMHRGVVTCRPETALTEVVHLMNERRIHAVVVVDDGEEPVGVLSQTDLLDAGFVAPYEKRFEEMRAWQLMTSPVTAVGPYTTLADAVQILHRHGIHRLVVVAEEGTEPKRPIGILSVTDLIRYLGKAYPPPCEVVPEA